MVDARNNHLKELDGQLLKMPEPLLMCFAAACTERLWPVYGRASVGKAWRRDQLRTTLDAVWEWLLGTRDRPRGLVAACQEAVDIFDEIGIQDDSESGASEVAVAVGGLADDVEAKRLTAGRNAAKGNLDFLDAFLQEYLDVDVSEAARSTIDAHELTVSERGRQNADSMFLLAGGDHRTIAAELRRRSAGTSIVGSYWYR